MKTPVALVAPGVFFFPRPASRHVSDDACGSSPVKTDELPTDNTTEARLKRKFVRAQRRLEPSSGVASQGGTSSSREDAQALAGKNAKSEAKTQLATPFGPVNGSRFHTSDKPFKIPSDARNYGKQSLGHKYSDLVSGLGKAARPTRRAPRTS
ncbi:hypothetical protein [Myxococcus sp. RHSTA-1-4]|uniref:hypothetical protein n=1 Tax=Myxococcus sp. RHSTA-1-4 TaxID=2874601 RepID=UPI001CBC3F3F|nr:hypothetical protein [Myxococcus sp. RHSTA-1-4]MBZ4422860.1 hypothetical protein [Myxococcus sp. RHSTA-1-4]